MDIKQISELRAQLLELEQGIELNVESNSQHANNRRELARNGLSTVRYHLSELIMDLQRLT